MKIETENNFFNNKDINAKHIKASMVPTTPSNMSISITKLNDSKRKTRHETNKTVKTYMVIKIVVTLVIFLNAIFDSIFLDPIELYT